MPKKVLVSGCYDLLHAGHVAFFETAAKYGELHVCIGSDDNIRLLKGHAPKFSQDERLYIVQSISHVSHARVSSGSGMLDFEPDLRELKPDYFVVNEDGSTPAKRALCEELGVEFVELPRTPKEGLPARSSSGIKATLNLPYRLCLAGGWIDQPWVSEIAPGSAVVVQIEPTVDFSLRSGMATSTRQHWQKLAAMGTTTDDHGELARLLFGYENPPGTQYVAGSQDAIGLTHAGINRLDYDGEYWPHHIETCRSQEVCDWLEQSLAIVPLFERPDGYDPLRQRHLLPEIVRRLGNAGRRCYEAIVQQDIRAFGKSMTATHDAWRDLLPETTNPEIDSILNSYNNQGYGRITSGCGGGYIFVATEEDLPGSFRIKVRN
ncbi:adenylyltransferase/cytidyltransferase family protein [Aeoliella mucimassa]|uniref:Bifunctional heptose 7-phosphate kinase/heptose 1-phosphate adenyltransferase n=1 Tax=Aeoliella mucimassa TaxID=2527972 RepID=A0A518ANR9_9BACT|nr:adenylyltransferase/cytidyltransferase family protein [Aeoliella mucimassa]QDU56369.1 bifunctional heptose 7-phosphate kinase/heptose 1-phosphate adenyltransferase [Aeoliella mucimassa]